MNKKYLFGMLLSGAMLAACTADDLNVAAPVAQEVNPSAPVFTVTFDDEELQNRAIYDNGAGINTLKWEDGDMMSLFHGIPSVTVKESTNGLKSWQNAVYEAMASDDAEAGLDFYTAAMVQPGYAVMVYPADVEFRNANATNSTLGNANPVVRVNKVQGPQEKDSIPFISEVIEITKNGVGTSSSDAGTAGVAGYRQKYEIAMKRAAGTLRLTLNKVNPKTITDPDVEPLKIKSVTLDLGENEERRNDLGNSRPFSLELPVVATEEIEASSEFGKANPTWKYRTSLDLHTDLGDPATSNKVSWSLKSTDVTNHTDGRDTVFFTILPLSAKGAKVIKGGDLIVETNYGYVTVHNSAKLYGANADATFMEAAENLLPRLWYSEHPDGATSKWDGEERGGYAGTTVKVDLDSLDMNGMHITTDSELKSAILIYREVYKDKTGAAKKVNFFLDGNEDGVFEMTSTTLDLVAEEMEKTNATTAKNGLTFTPCADIVGEECETIEITHGGVTKEIPSLIFEGDGVAVELVGNWGFEDVDVPEGDSNNLKAMTGVSGITVTEGTLRLANYIAVSDGLDEGLNIAKDVDVTINEGITKAEVQGIPLYNSGNIMIDEDQTLIAGADGVIENNPLPQDNDKTVTGLTEGAGYIENHGLLGVDQAKNGEINNYGTIKIVGTTADTKVTTNGKSGNFLGKAYDGTNVHGTIILPNGNGNNKTIVGGQQGFIKLHISSDTQTGNTVGMANYLVVDAGCTTLTTAASAKDGIQTGTNGVKYIELGTAKNVELTGIDYTLNALIVPYNAKLYILKGINVAIDNTDGVVSVNGLISVTGSLKQNSTNYEVDQDEVNYFGKNAKGQIVYYE